MRAAGVDDRARLGWIALAIAAALMWGLAMSLVLAGGCAHAGPRAQAFGSDVVHDCVAELGSAATDAVGQAVASAGGAPGAPSWGTFAIGELLTRGVGFAICVAEQGLAALDMKLPAAPADPNGNISPAAVATTEASAARGLYGYAPPATPQIPAEVARDVTAHARMVDFLNAHGVKHAHAVVDSGGAK